MIRSNQACLCHVTYPARTVRAPATQVRGYLSHGPAGHFGGGLINQLDVCGGHGNRVSPAARPGQTEPPGAAAEAVMSHRLIPNLGPESQRATLKGPGRATLASAGAGAAGAGL